MRRKTFIYWLIGSLLMSSIFYACYKQKTKNPEQEIALLRSVYEELSKRHNDFLARSFIGIRSKLAARRQARTTSSVTEAEMHDMVLQESSLNLVPVLGSVYTSNEIFNTISKNLPDDLTLLSFNSTAACIADIAGGISLTSIFIRSLDELDQLLDKCRNYQDSSAIIPAFDRLLNKYAPLLTNSAEKEAFIAGATLGKYSFSYWSENERRIGNMFNEVSPSSDNNNANPVKSDVRGMIRGVLSGIACGGLWGSIVPGVGTICGVISGGIVGAVASGCVGSLAAGLWNLLF